MAKDQRKAILFALASILMWSTMGSAFKLTLQYVHYAVMVLFTAGVALAFLTVLLLVTGQFKKVLKTPARDVFRSALLGLLNPFGYYLVIFKAYELLPAQDAVALNYVWPLMLTLLAVPILGHRITWMNIIALVISFAGATIIATDGNIRGMDFSNGFGVALALGSSLIWASFWLLNVSDKRDEVQKLFLNFLFGFIYVLIYVLLFHPIVVPPLKGLGGVLYIGLFEMGVSFVLWLKALKYASNTAKISNLVYLSPFMSLIFISMLVGEAILPSTVLGLILIIGGILLQNFVGTKKAPESAS